MKEATSWLEDERTSSFYATMVSLLLLVAQTCYRRWAVRKQQEEELVYWLPKSQKLVRMAIQLSCGILSIAEVVIAGILLAECKDGIQVTFFLSLVRNILSNRTILTASQDLCPLVATTVSF